MSGTYSEYQDIQFNESSERIIKFIELSKKYPNSRKVYSGGDSKLDKKINQSMHAKEFLENLTLKISFMKIDLLTLFKISNIHMN